MFTKLYVALSILLAKVPHAVLLIALTVTIWGPKLVAMIAGTSLAPWASDINDAVTFATGILALAKQFTPDSQPAKQSDAAILAKAKEPSTVPPLAMLCFGGLLAVLCAGCSPAANQTGLNTIPADIGLLTCAITVYEADSAKNETALEVSADEIATCGKDAAAILTIIDGHIVEDVLAGKLDAPTGNARIAEYHTAFHFPLPTKTVGTRGHS